MFRWRGRRPCEPRRREILKTRLCKFLSPHVSPSLRGRAGVGLLDCKCKVKHKKNAAEGIFRRVRVLPSLGKSFSSFAEFLPKTGVFCQSFAEFFTKFLSQHATCYFALVFSSNSNVRSPILLYALNRLPLTGALSSRHSSTGFVKLCTSMRCTFLRAGRC